MFLAYMTAAEVWEQTGFMNCVVSYATWQHFYKTGSDAAPMLLLKCRLWGSEIQVENGLDLEIKAYSKFSREKKMQQQQKKTFVQLKVKLLHCFRVLFHSFVKLFTPW